MKTIPTDFRVAIEHRGVWVIVGDDYPKVQEAFRSQVSILWFLICADLGITGLIFDIDLGPSIGTKAVLIWKSLQHITNMTGRKTPSLSAIYQVKPAETVSETPVDASA